MSTPTMTEQDSLKSRLPDPSQFLPEVATIAGAMAKAVGNGSIPPTTISLVQLRAGQIVGNTYAERVALELVEAVLPPNPFGERVPDQLYAKASAHYDDKALWTLTLAIGQICFFIPVALIAKPIPGRPPGEHYSK